MSRFFGNIVMVHGSLPFILCHQEDVDLKWFQKPKMVQIEGIISWIVLESQLKCCQIQFSTFISIYLFLAFFLSHFLHSRHLRSTRASNLNQDQVCKKLKTQSERRSCYFLLFGGR